MFLYKIASQRCGRKGTLRFSPRKSARRLLHAQASKLASHPAVWNVAHHGQQHRQEQRQGGGNKTEKTCHKAVQMFKLGQLVKTNVTSAKS